MRRGISILLTTIIFLLLLFTFTFAHSFPITKIHIMPPHEKLLEKKVEIPKIPEVTPESIPQGTRIYGTIEKAQGIGKAIVIPVEFTDKPKQPDDVIPSNYFNILFNSEGADWSTINPYNVGSVREFYLENSYNQFDITATILPWYTAKYTYTTYINDGDYGFSGGVFVLVSEVLQNAVNNGYDLRNYDVIFIIHSGQGAEWTGDTNDIWSHASAVYVTINGQRVPVRYTIQPEYMLDYDSLGNPVIVPQTVGVFVHEMGHAFGKLPDLYDRDYSSLGLGRWSLMAGGSWNGPTGPGGYSIGGGPSHFDAWSKIQLGWVTPIVPKDNLTNVTIPPVEKEPVVYKLWTDGEEGPQYFLLENRQAIGFDRFLRGFGLLIYHVDEKMRNYQNDVEWYPGLDPTLHYLVALEQANGLWQLEKRQSSGNPGHPYPGSTGNTSFDTNSTPNSNAYGEIPTGVAVRNIAVSGENITCDIFVKQEAVPSAPTFISHFAWLNENPNTLRPLFKWVAPNSTESQLQVAEDPNFEKIIIDITTDKTEYRPTLEKTLYPGTTYYVRVRSKNSIGYSPWTTKSFTTPTTLEALLVSDDGGEYGIAPYIEKSLIDANINYFIIDVFNDNAVPSADDMALFNFVVWAGDWGAIYDPSIQEEIMRYLDNGGKLLISSQDLGWGYYAGYIDPKFYNQYLKAEFVQDDVGIYSVKGLSNTPFSNISFNINTRDSAMNQVYLDEIDPLEGAVPIFMYDPNISPSPIMPEIKIPEKIKVKKSPSIVNKVTASSGTAGLYYIDPDKHFGVVYLAFGLEGVDPSVSGTIMKKVKDLLTNPPSITATATSVFDPSKNENCNINITVSDEIGYSYLTIKVYSTINGQKNLLIKTLENNTKVINGTYQYTWDGKDESGAIQPYGRYLIEIIAKDELNNTTKISSYTTIPSSLPLSILNVTKFTKSFNPKEGPAEIFFNITQNANVKFIVYDLSGVKLYERDLGYLPAGNYSILWDGVNWKGQTLKNGLYLFQIVAKSDQGEVRINRFIGILK